MSDENKTKDTEVSEKDGKKEEGRSNNEANIPEVKVEVIVKEAVPEMAKKNNKEPAIAKDTLTQLIPKIEIFPEKLGIVAVQHRPLFPNMVIPLVVEGDLYQKTLQIAQKNEPAYLGIVLSKPNFDLEKPKIADLYEYGVIARIAKVFSQDAKGSQILLDVLQRIRIVGEVSNPANIMLAKVEYIKTGKVKINDEIRAFSREILTNMKELIQLNPLIKEELNQFVNQISLDDPNRLADFAATLATTNKDELQMILATTNIVARLSKTLLLIKKELELSKLQADISKRIEEKISEKQRQFFLKEQLKEIRKELGLSKDEKTQEIEKFQKKAQKLDFSDEAKERFEEEMGKISLLDVQSPEFNVCRNYLDWITTLPWGLYSKDNVNITKARKILETDHYGLEDVKEIILEFIATLKLKKEISGTILCFLGPPGVGKTSIGKSIARALHRQFYRFSVGGMRDEAEIKGHRRTYIGAMPGKFLQALKITKFANPVIMLDEIDKIGNSYQGDPASALLEVLDPDQNVAFVDHYIDIPFDLSKILFIATANQLDTIPPALLDRMEVVRLPGYIAKEKQKIARKYLIPKQRKAHGLSAKMLDISNSAVKKIIDGYAREAGVRNLENQIKKICRKVTKEIAENESHTKFNIGQTDVKKYLKNPIFDKDELIGEGKVGITTGLAWTNMGGTVMSVEASKTISHRKGMQQTGQLGDVMVESSEIAYSFVVANAKKFGGDPEFFKNFFIHLHVPAGATPKDGPSAGITMATVLLSLLLGRPVVKKLGMTGELTLVGEVLPIGGLKEKIIAARRVGLKAIVIPEQNRKDYLEVPDHLTEKLNVHFAKMYDDVFHVAFP